MQLAYTIPPEYAAAFVWKSVENETFGILRLDGFINALLLKENNVQFYTVGYLMHDNKTQSVKKHYL